MELYTKGRDVTANVNLLLVYGWAWMFTIF